MELEELKKAWAALDDRLKKSESLKETVISEMIQSKAGKSINRLMNLEVLNIVVILIIIPFIVFSLERRGGKFPVWDVLMIFCAVLCLIIFIWELYKIHGLMKIDFSKDIRDTIYYVNQYNVKIQREYISVYIIGPVLGILGILTYAEAKATISLWVFLTCILILAAFMIYYSRKSFDKKIKSIMKSLNELKELREEE